VLTARDDATAARLSGRPLRPNGNLAGYIAQPPGLITTMAGARAFSSYLFAGIDPSRGISAVRVRVEGVTGIDAVSRERIRQAAQRIAAATELDVDITAGASGAPTAIDLPAGRLGRPRLALSETWVRKGVAARVLSAVDRKSLLLFALILVVCALFVTNAASAAVRARRDELGVLACLGLVDGPGCSRSCSRRWRSSGSPPGSSAACWRCRWRRSSASTRRRRARRSQCRRRPAWRCWPDCCRLPARPAPSRSPRSAPRCWRSGAHGDRAGSAGWRWCTSSARPGARRSAR
jgi:hypothetical protein